MRNRLGFLGFVGLCTALLGCGCDSPTVCQTTATRIQDVCGADAFGMFMAEGAALDRAGFESACGTTNTACQTCVDGLLTDAAGCASLADCQGACVGIMPPDAGPGDAGTDADVPPGPTMCQVTSRSGGQCRGSSCSPGLTCFPELSTGMAGPFTLENIFEIPSAIPDPANPGEFLTEADLDPPMDLPAVPIRFGPGGQCTEGCNPAAATDSCDACSTCSRSIGGSDAFGAVGITVRTFDVNEPPLTNDTNTGICRADCVFDPANTGCQTGYTCEVGENVCLEGCTADAQCNLGWGQTRRDGLVAVVDGESTCNTTTGRCEWTPPAGAAFGSECESNTDCPADVGVCLIGGRCSTYQCNLMDETGAAAYPCPTGAVCVGIGGNAAAFCLDTCETPDDCFPGIACTPIFSDGSSACWGICGEDSECHADEACQKGGFADPEVGTCQPRCTPGGTDCATDEVCVQVAGQTYGFCEGLDEICGADSDCVGGQACEVLGADALGRCVDGCTLDTDCAAGQQCRIQAGGETCEEDADCPSGECTIPTGMTMGTCDASTAGICRTPGGECANRPRNMAGTAFGILLRGDPQCVEAQTCDSEPGTLGTCAGALPDAGVGTPDAGVDAG